MNAVISWPPIPIFELGPLNLSLHGLFAALGFLAGAVIATKLAVRWGYDDVKIQSTLTWGLIGAMLGARYFTAPAQIIGGAEILTALNPVSGNFSILGGFAGGILAGYYRIRKLGLSFWETSDFWAFGLAVGTIVGRIGDLAIVEHLGRQSDFFLAFGLKPGYEPAPQHTSIQAACDSSATAVGDVCASYHFSALYDMIGATVLLAVLLGIYRLWKARKVGQMFGFWVIWYGIQRFVIDFTRLVPEGESGAGAADAHIGAFTYSQWSGLGSALLGVALILWFQRNETTEVAWSANLDMATGIESDVGELTGTGDAP
jgi:phosphatidylglycerol:prolipoprotein diacylglycerol transferase